MFSQKTLTALVAGSLFSGAWATSANSYALSDTYTATNFNETFSFYVYRDPTDGSVEYVNSSVAQALDIAHTTSSGAIFLGVDSTNNVTNGKRPSTRVNSNKMYNQHLMIADIAHMPVGCGVAPAFAELGPNSPRGGEINIIDGMNSQTEDNMALYTFTNCTVNNGSASTMTGSMFTTDCNYAADGVEGAGGCAATSQTTRSYGEAFNAYGGGVYAVEYTTTGVSIWFFEREQIPADIASNSSSPDPSSWGLPQAAFLSNSCDLPASIYNLSLVLDVELCGTSAGPGWNQSTEPGQPSCAVSTGVPTCEAFVASYPEEFAQAHWEINSIRIYEQQGQPQQQQQQQHQKDGTAKREAQADSGSLFSSPNGTTVDECEQFTPGHCSDKDGYGSVTSGAVASRGWTATPLVVGAAALAFATAIM